ncbi:hypothetical protein M1B72_06105 [Geomonas paludis]|uniref:Uncharacterized protein n=1 Tax=Geomonas paludis TaxID=2740185 RepID=A0A6V8N081_9BACT|nr:hypothetical protein [Geomonas paludis]UPU37276.1 hypothetical protein M1B72_06105 [Geomonas paludis]GFO65173.1 hypothetical protein GMPD_30920 [Geomonas paludis]
MSSTLWSIVCVAGVWGFVTCTVFFILRAFPARDAFEGKAALKWGAGVVGFFVVWIIGMMQA